MKQLMRYFLVNRRQFQMLHACRILWVSLFP